jgi:hypothetical protein
MLPRNEGIIQRDLAVRAPSEHDERPGKFQFLQQEAQSVSIHESPRILIST